MAIPRLEGKCTENYPQKWELLRFLVGIVTWFHGAGGIATTSVRTGLAMTGNLQRNLSNNNLPRSRAPLRFYRRGMTRR